MSNNTVKVDFEETPTKGRFVARITDLDDIGELTISKVSETLIIADHTLVPDTLRGRGVAGALVDALVAQARARGQRIVPLCPFVGAQFQRHPEWSDVLQR